MADPAVKAADPCQVCSMRCEKFGKHGLVKPKQVMRSLVTPLRMNAGMDDDVAPKKPQPEVFDGPLLSSRDKAKIERRKRKEERQREMGALRAGMPPVYVNHSNDGGPAVRDIHMENFSVTVGGLDLIQETTITLAFGRHYGCEDCRLWSLKESVSRGRHDC